MLFVAIVFLLLTGHSLGDATGNFSCQFYSDEEKSLKIICGQTQRKCVREIPLNTTDVIRLKIERCALNVIGDASGKFQHIQSLDISHSGYNSLNWTGKVFKNVSDLNISFNKLTAVPAEILSQFPKLETLDLSNNKIAKISADDFKSAHNLMLCNLSNNILESIEAKAFDNLNVKSTEIVLSHNRLSTFPVALLRAETIDMLENPYLSSINCTFINMVRSKHVYFSWKYITVFAGDQNCGKLKFSLQNHEIEGIMPDSSNNFWLRYNEQSFRNVQHFVAGSGGFKNVEPIFNLLNGESVLKIDLSKNEIVLSRNETFERFRKLKDLNLSETGLKTINFYMLKLPEALQRLDISKNHLEAVVGAGAVQYLRQLVYFNAAGNHIHNANKILKDLQPSVQQLNLAGNIVGNITFEQLTALTHLNLSDTNLTISNADQFKPLRNLISLDLSRNNLSDVNIEAILNSSNQLQVFRAANCQIKNVSEVIQYVKPSVKDLDLSGNKIGPPINASLLQTLGNLTHLNLSGTQLQKFDLEALIPLSELHTLDISHNELHTINLKPLSNLTQLERLYLNDNDLSKLDNFNWTASPNVSLAIAGNHFSCMHLKDLRYDIPNLKYIGNQLDQKHGEDCLSSMQAIGDFLSSVYDKVKFW